MSDDQTCGHLPPSDFSRRLEQDMAKIFKRGRRTVAIDGHDYTRDDVAAAERAELVAEIERLTRERNDAEIAAQQMEEMQDATIADLRARLAEANERLENDHVYGTSPDGETVRIDVEPGSIPDGIDCRDETIRLQDARIAALEAALAGFQACRTAADVQRVRELPAERSGMCPFCGTGHSGACIGMSPPADQREQQQRRTFDHVVRAADRA